MRFRNLVDTFSHIVDTKTTQNADEKLNGFKYGAFWKRIVLKPLRFWSG